MSKLRLGVYFLVGTVFVVGSIDYLDLESAYAAQQQILLDLYQKNQTLEAKNAGYQADVHELSQVMSQRDAQLALLGERVEDVEMVLGLDGNDIEQREADWSTRLHLVAMDSALKAAMLEAIPNGSPLEYKRISSLYGKRSNPISGRKQTHTGIDLTCNVGDPIIAPADGVIETVRASKKGFGNFLTVRHAYGFMTSYAHLDRFKARNGQFVKKGDLIATCGNSGNSTGPHLHYETRFVGRSLDPKILMDWNIRSFSLPFENEKKVNWRALAALVEERVNQKLLLSSPPRLLAENALSRLSHIDRVDSGMTISGRQVQ
ncbi:M23 family metallopeptidase [Vibrio sinensis]|nr:M23 family metallopeptidase [Vibrio sinensis]